MEPEVKKPHRQPSKDIKALRLPRDYKDWVRQGDRETLKRQKPKTTNA